MKSLSRIALSLTFTLIASVAHAQSPGAQEPRAFEKQVTRSLKARYLIYLPKEYNAEPNKRWPLVMFLHGAGESGDDVEKVKIHGPPKLISQGKAFPFIVVSPQAASRGEGWSNEVLIALLDDVINQYRVDKDRVYLTGLSMGGFGTWSLAAAYPDRFAAIAPICGGGQRRSARRLKDLPIWAFHGAKDEVVRLSESQEMVDAVKAAGGSPKFTIYPEAGHDSWTETYNNPQLYEWLLEQRRKPAQPQ